eukprot:Pompholyxophrys_punicea_v1_NODE_417_length_2014_cov_7.111281.p1 type:complete len:268 gc:universal NODE_417_length_2014_cov_7.111281:1128-325(-)
MALTRLFESVATGFSMKQLGVGLFLDIQTAFDSVSHELLLRKLPRYGISGPLLAWFSSCLEGRSQFIMSCDGPSPPALVISGVPQGSVLGPVLFDLFINDLPEVLTVMWPSLFADDTNLFAFSRSIEDLVAACTTELHWLARNQLQANTDKSSVLLFVSAALQRAHGFRLLPLPFLDSALYPVGSVKFLGLHFSSSLSWSPFVDSLLKKLTRLSGLFYLISPSLPTCALLLLYNALVLPHLCYGIELWGSPDPRSTYLRPIYRLQKD